MEKLKKMILFKIPMSICNFRCSYCYLAQREECYQNIQPNFNFTPEFFGRAFSKERLGGICYFNFCADGETFLTKDIHLYVKEILKNGHYVEIITNLTISNILDKFLDFDKDLLGHIEFKCSFHYLELKKKNLLDVYATNVKKIWTAGASACVEITPSDDLIPFIDEVKKYSMENFGALPQLSIARNDASKKIDYLTELPMNKYDEIWGQFKSPFWEFKKTIFGKKQKKFCYAGQWSYYIDIYSGDIYPCYFGGSIGNAYENINKPLPEKPVGKCELAHCYNGHVYLTLGVIPGATKVRYGDIRDRKKNDGNNWLQKDLKDFFNNKLEDNNIKINPLKQKFIITKNFFKKIKYLLKRIIKKI